MTQQINKANLFNNVTIIDNLPERGCIVLKNRRKGTHEHKYQGKNVTSIYEMIRVFPYFSSFMNRYLGLVEWEMNYQPTSLRILF